MNVECRGVERLQASLAAGHVACVWNPWEEENLELYYPGDEYVDWIGVTNLNYGYAASNGQWYPFEGLYKPFSEKLRNYKKPVMLSEFGTTTFGGSQAELSDEILARDPRPEVNGERLEVSLGQVAGASDGLVQQRHSVSKLYEASHCGKRYVKIRTRRRFSGGGSRLPQAPHHQLYMRCWK